MFRRIARYDRIRFDVTRYYRTCGNNGAIVAPSADLDLVVRGVAFAAIFGKVQGMVFGAPTVKPLQHQPALLPVFAHLEGLCHVFVHGQADLAMARDIGVCLGE